METNEPMVMTTFRIEPDTYGQILTIAEREDRTVSDVIRQAINYYLKELR